MGKSGNHSEGVWLETDGGDFEAFRQLVEQQVDPATYPLVDRVVSNVPIYDGEMINVTGDGRMALMAEWVSVLKSGPGIVVIEGTFSDTKIVDRATMVFEALIAQEKEDGLGDNDHFAKPGSNDRIWNALEKHCMADPEGFALYYANPVIAAVCEAWLGPAYQVTAQVNCVNPGGAAQNAHRDYHLGFMAPEQMVRYPAHVHDISPILTLQGAVVHCDMPLESGPTMYLPFSQMFFEGYLAFGRSEFQEYFAENYTQLPLKKGDVVFFNPALMHGAGSNVSLDILRMANLLQVSSAFGRAMESVDRAMMARKLYPVLQLMEDLSSSQIDAVISASAEGYPFPTNLDRDPPIGGLAPKSQQMHMREALEVGMSVREFAKLLDQLGDKRRTN
ncbi:MAG: phytanoyl-CoA dioxygenase family protein [Rhizobiaceae bacterium]|nr:phytanoyl-CoA dioxygenase family protein [Rhizobiaceae bacterium]